MCFESWLEFPPDMLYKTTCLRRTWKLSTECRIRITFAQTTSQLVRNAASVTICGAAFPKALCAHLGLVCAFGAENDMSWMH